MKKDILIFISLVLSIASTLSAGVIALTASQELQVTPEQKNLLTEMFDTHMHYFLSNDSVTSYGLPLTAYKVGDRARFGYSNPTEWGYLLQSYVAADERGIISESEAVRRINISLNTISALQQNPLQSYNLSLFYPYYKVTNSGGSDIFPYHDASLDIPSIDNGLLYMSLLIVEGWARDAGNSEIEIKAKTIKDRMNFRMFLFSQGNNKYLAHVINAGTGQIGSSKWDVYSDEGGMMSLIAYFSNSINFSEYTELINSEMRSPAAWNGYTVQEAAWFNAMFTWGVRSIAGFDIVNTPYSTNSFVPTTEAHLAYGDSIGVNYPGFSDAMSQVNGVGRYTPPNLANEAPLTAPMFITPHAFFVPFNVLSDLSNSTVSNLISKIRLLKEDSAGYYHNTGAYPYGFEVVASPYVNNTGFSGSGSGRLNFETLSQSYIVLSLFNALQYTDNQKDFSDFAEIVPGYSAKASAALSFLYPTTNCVDSDADGFNVTGGSCGSVDCNDNNVLVHPGAVESCNGIDDNCDGNIDEGCMSDCVIPTDGMIITTDTTFCPGTYYLPNGTSLSSDNVILDCNNAEIIGNGTLFKAGIRVNTTGYYKRMYNTIKNCNLKGFYWGIFHWDGRHNSYVNNTLSNNTYAFYFDNADSETLIGNKIYNNYMGILFYYSSNNHIVQYNQLENNSWGIYYTCVHSASSGSKFLGNIAVNNAHGIYSCNSNNLFENNTLERNGYGFEIDGQNNVIYHNNLIDNYFQAKSYKAYSSNNTWNYNYWSNYDSPEEGCNDANNDGKCDVQYNISSSNADKYPFTYQNGWNLPFCLPADFNADGIVDVGDLGILSANYGQQNRTHSQGDANYDKLVDVGDLGILSANYGGVSIGKCNVQFPESLISAGQASMPISIELTAAKVKKVSQPRNAKIQPSAPVIKLSRPKSGSKGKLQNVIRLN